MSVDERWLSLARAQSGRFWSKVDKSAECWTWTAGKCKDGYGKFQINDGWCNGRPIQKHVRAHRISWEMIHGPLPDGLVIMHSCDNPACVRPEHLSPGTQGENRDDCVKKGRGAAGERHGMAKIDAEAARKLRQMRADGMRPIDIIRATGLPKNLVHQVTSGRTWRAA